MSRIMVVDDESLIASGLKERLVAMGFEVAGIAFSGEEAVAKARSLRPDLILMDIMLKTGKIDGIEAAEIIRNELDISVLFVTAYENEKIIARAKTVEPVGFILKPFVEAELRAVIELAVYKIERERELKASEERYRSVLVTAVEAILIADIRMNVVFWNKAAESMFGHSAEEIEGKPFLRLIPARIRTELTVEVDRMVLTEEKNPVARTTETVGLRKDGSEFPMEFSLSSWVIRDDIFFTINARDITDRKKVEQLKTDFVSLVSHQLKTPVAGVLGCIDNLLAGIAGPITKEQEEYLRMMKDVSLRNYRNISDLLNVSRLDRGVVDATIRPVALKPVVAAVLREHRHRMAEKGVALRLDGWNCRINVMADRDKLFEAVSNIVHNAVKFTEKGQIAVRLRREPSAALVEIEDTGQGIPYDLQHHLFKQNMILRGAPDVNRGSGLGLYIAKEFMRLLNGDITVVSTPGKGSRFTFHIPLTQSQSRG
jgi:PAS domain S-box-containing protein